MLVSMKAVAYHTTASFIRVIGSEFVQRYLGGTQKRICHHFHRRDRHHYNETVWHSNRCWPWGAAPFARVAEPDGWFRPRRQCQGMYLLCFILPSHSNVYFSLMLSWPPTAQILYILPFSDLVVLIAKSSSLFAHEERNVSFSRHAQIKWILVLMLTLRIASHFKNLAPWL